MGCLVDDLTVGLFCLFSPRIYLRQRIGRHIFHCHSQEEIDFLALVPSHYCLAVLLAFICYNESTRYFLCRDELWGPCHVSDHNVWSTYGARFFYMNIHLTCLKTVVITCQYVLLLHAHGVPLQTQMASTNGHYGGANFANGGGRGGHAHGLLHFHAGRRFLSFAK